MTLPRKFAIAALPALLVFGGTGAAAQSVVRDEPACARCSISGRRIVRLGDEDGPGALAGGNARVRVDSRGRYWVTDFRGGLPQIFSADGRFLTEVGKRGQGPGEFMGNVNPVPVSADSVLVMEPAQMRGTLFDLDLHAGRVISMPGQLGIGLVARWPQSVFVIGSVQAREPNQGRVHRISLSDRRAEVLTSGAPPEKPGSAQGTGMYAAVSGNGQFWTSEYTAAGYRLTQWDSALHVLQQIERAPKAWQRSPQGSVGSPNTPPDHALTSLAVDAAGLLWVFVQVPARDWRAAWADVQPGATVTADRMQSEKLYNTMVEVIDPASKRVLARTSLAARTIALPQQRAASFVQSADGVPIIDILELTLTGR